MASQAKLKQTYGYGSIEHFSPKPNSTRWPNAPQAINIVLGFEEALKLHLAIGERLSAINKMNRTTKEGKRAAVNLCAYIQLGGTVTVTAGKLSQ